MCSWEPHPKISIRLRDKSFKMFRAFPSISGSSFDRFSRWCAELAATKMESNSFSRDTCTSAVSQRVAQIPKFSPKKNFGPPCRTPNPDHPRCACCPSRAASTDGQSDYSAAQTQGKQNKSWFEKFKVLKFWILGQSMELTSQPCPGPRLTSLVTSIPLKKMSARTELKMTGN